MKDELNEFLKVTKNLRHEEISTLKMLTSEVQQ